MTHPDWKYYAIYYAAGIGIPFAMIVLLGMALGFIFAEGAVVP